MGLLGLLGNVLAGAYVFEITRTVGGVQGLDWASSLQAPSFWLLVLVLVLLGLYGWGAARSEARVRRALNETDVLGIALGELIGPMIKTAKRDVEEGRLHVGRRKAQVRYGRRDKMNAVFTSQAVEHLRENGFERSDVSRFLDVVGTVAQHATEASDLVGSDHVVFVKSSGDTHVFIVHSGDLQAMVTVDSTKPDQIVVLSVYKVGDESRLRRGRVGLPEGLGDGRFAT